MTLNKQNFSKNTLQYIKKAVQDTKSEWKDFKRIRSRFYFLSGTDNSVKSLELREFIDQIIQDFKLKVNFDERESDYFNFMHLKFFDILSMKLHRLSPDYYLIMTQKMDGEIVFIVRDRLNFPSTNLRITWDGPEFKDFKLDEVPFHFSKKELE